MSQLKNVFNNSTPLENKFIDPEAVLNQIGSIEGYKIADFGCGTGYFSIVAARKIGASGTVWALDVLPQRLESVKSQSKLEGLNNIITSRVNLEKIEGSKLEAESIDLVIMKDVLFQNGNKKVILEEAYRVAKKNGKALVIEWDEGQTAIGPNQNLRIAKAELKNLAENIGWNLEKEIKTGNFHYGLLFIK